MFGNGMRAIDTNVLVRLITRDDPRQAASAEAFIQGGAWISGVWISLCSATEAVWVLGLYTTAAPPSLPGQSRCCLTVETSWPKMLRV